MNSVFPLKVLRMNNLAITVITGSALTAVSCSSDAARKPNIILILADDLGYGDLGVYGQEKIETPNIDLLAASGMIFRQFYSGAPVSAPARCTLLTGLHTGHCQVRGNDEWRERGDVWNYRAMVADSTLEGQKPMLPGTLTFPQLLRKAGYRTGMTGKWGLGAPHTESIPTKMGFDWFFGINCQRMAHTYFPVFLYENERRFYLGNDTVAPNTLLTEGADPRDPESYKQYTLKEYAPDVMFRKTEDFIKSAKDSPFFLYWATPIPHVALQAPQRWIDYYVKKFGDEPPYRGEKGYFPQRYPHAAYAAMVSFLDEQIGLLTGMLKNLGIYENTIIILTSDNGPAPNGGSDSPWFRSAGPFRSETGYAKGNLNEGGIRVPLIVSWPAKIKAGSESEHVAALWDMFPTICDLAGIGIPSGLDGISFLPELTGRKQAEHEYLYWEYPESGGQQAIRIGDLKVLRKNMNKGNTSFEVYNVKDDPRETVNLADKYPDMIEKALIITGKEHVASENERWKITGLDK